MNRAPPQLKKLLEPVVAAMGYELVGIEYYPQGRRSLLRLYIDTPSGVTIDDCSRVSHQISGVLEVEDPIPGSYTLEISSPGLDRPLFEIPDFERFIGHKIQVRISQVRFSSLTKKEEDQSADAIAGRRKIIGLLKDVRGVHIVVEEQGRELVLPLERIEKANLIPEV